MHKSTPILKGIFCFIKQKTYQRNHQGIDFYPDPDSKKNLHFYTNNKVFLRVKYKGKNQNVNGGQLCKIAGLMEAKWTKCLSTRNFRGDPHIFSVQVPDER
jgi:hypothetical protein